MPDLQKAQDIIFSNIRRLPGEVLDLRDGLHRTVYSDVAAITPQPSYDESTRDGYVIPLFLGHDRGTRRFKIVGEIPAGLVYADGLLPGTACRIMTGGCVPEGGGRVVPYEKCVEQNGELLVAEHLLQSEEIYIRKTGSEIAQGDILVKSGVKLQPMHLALLSSSGVRSVVVSPQPAVGFLCTGSELKSFSSGLEEGQKFSSNSFLLHGLSALSGACPEDLGIIEDSASDLLDLFVEVKGRELDLLVSTGGMGPGKYDLVRDAFVEAGGQVILTTLDMRPGKSVLFGTLGKTLFFGLPGPPDAAQTLFNVLVRPALLAMQGREAPWPQKVQAHLQHQIKVKRHEVPRLKDGVLSLDGGRCSVRFAEKIEISNCYLILQSGQPFYSEGDLVDIYMIAVSS
jgi:molybdopterin molybdotransferase